MDCQRVQLLRTQYLHHLQRFCHHGHRSAGGCGSFVPTLTEEVNNLRNAQKSRGINFEKCSIIKRIKSNIAILVPLFMSVFRRAEQLAATMILRGYTDGKHRTHIRQSNWSKFDSLILIVVLLVFGLILSLNINF